MAVEREGPSGARRVSLPDGGDADSPFGERITRVGSGARLRPVLDDFVPSAGSPGSWNPGAESRRAWDETVKLLLEGRLDDFVRRLRTVPAHDPHAPLARSYLATYDPEHNPALRPAIDGLTRLLLTGVTALLQAGDRAALAEVVERMAQARSLIDAYNSAHPDRRIAHPTKIDQLEGTALRGLRVLNLRDRARRAARAGLVSEARSAFLELRTLAPDRAETPEGRAIGHQIERLADALETAQRFQVLGPTDDPTSSPTILARARERVAAAARTLVEAIEEASAQARQDALCPPPHGSGVTIEDVEALAFHRDILQVGARLLDLQSGLAALQQTLKHRFDPEALGREYQPLLSSADALLHTLWQQAASPYPVIQRLCASASDLARNLLEAEVRALVSAAEPPAVTDRDAHLVTAQAYAVLQRAARFEPNGHALGHDPDPRNAATRSIRQLARRLAALQRAHPAPAVRPVVTRLARPALAPIALIALIALVALAAPGALLAGLGTLTPARDWLREQYLEQPEEAAPTRSPARSPTLAPARATVERAERSDRVFEERPGCVYVEISGHNVCNDADGARFLEVWLAHRWFFGNPLTERISDAADPTVVVQYFEGGRIELHARDAAEPLKLGLLGEELLQLDRYREDWERSGRPRAAAPAPGGEPASDPSPHVAAELREVWTRFGPALLGYPLLDASVEERDGVQVRVQWFQRARLEAPVGSTGSEEVRLGFVGLEALREIVGLEPAPYRLHEGSAYEASMPEGSMREGSAR